MEILLLGFCVRLFIILPDFILIFVYYIHIILFLSPYAYMFGCSYFPLFVCYSFPFHTDAGLQRQITSIQNIQAQLQGKVSNLEGRIDSLQSAQTQPTHLSDAVRKHEEIKRDVNQLENRLSMLETRSGDMNLDLKTAREQIDELRNDVRVLKLNNITEIVRGIRYISFTVNVVSTD